MLKILLEKNQLRKKLSQRDDLYDQAYVLLQAKQYQAQKKNLRISSRKIQNTNWLTMPNIGWEKHTMAGATMNTLRWLLLMDIRITLKVKRPLIIF